MREEMLREIDRELHDLSQPLTTLQCCLELGQVMGDPASLKEAVEGGIAEMQRIFAAVTRMREMLAREETTSRG